MTITAEFTLFCPTIGQTLIGHVNKTSSDHIGILVHGLFNASINAENIPESLLYNDEEQAWGDIVNGSVISFRVDDYLVLNSCFSLVGSLDGNQLGSVDVELAT